MDRRGSLKASGALAASLALERVVAPVLAAQAAGGDEPRRSSRGSSDSSCATPGRPRCRPASTATRCTSVSRATARSGWARARRSSATTKTPTGHVRPSRPRAGSCSPVIPGGSRPCSRDPSGSSASATPPALRSTSPSTTGSARGSGFRCTVCSGSIRRPRRSPRSRSGSTRPRSRGARCAKRPRFRLKVKVGRDGDEATIEAGARRHGQAAAGRRQRGLAGPGDRHPQDRVAGLARGRAGRAADAAALLDDAAWLRARSPVPLFADEAVPARRRHSRAGRGLSRREPEARQGRRHP